MSNDLRTFSHYNVRPLLLLQKAILIVCGDWNIGQTFRTVYILDIAFQRQFVSLTTISPIHALVLGAKASEISVMFFPCASNIPSKILLFIGFRYPLPICGNDLLGTSPLIALVLDTIGIP